MLKAAPVLFFLLSLKDRTIARNPHSSSAKFQPCQSVIDRAIRQWTVRRATLPGGVLLERKDAHRGPKKYEFRAVRGWRGAARRIHRSKSCWHLNVCFPIF